MTRLRSASFFRRKSNDFSLVDTEPSTDEERISRRRNPRFVGRLALGDLVMFEGASREVSHGTADKRCFTRIIVSRRRGHTC